MPRRRHVVVATFSDGRVYEQARAEMDARGWEPCVRPPQTVGKRANNGRTHQGNRRSTIASMGTGAAAEAGKHRFLLRCAATHAQISNGLAQRERGSPLGGIRGPVRALAERDSTTAIVRIGDASSSPRATTDSHQWTGGRSEQTPTGARSHWQVTACVGNTAPLPRPQVSRRGLRRDSGI